MERDAAPAQPPAFGETLRRFRLAAGLTQEALAQRATLSVRAVTDLERGINRAPRRETLRLLAEALRLAEQDRALLLAAARRPPASAVAPAPRDPKPRLVLVPADTGAPLVERAHEIALLDRHLAGGGPPVLLFAGEPGIGKSRLLAEATARAAGHGLSALPGGCRRQDTQVPYAPLTDTLAALLQRQAPRRRRALLAGCAWLVRLLPELVEQGLLPTPLWTLPPEQERRLLFQAVARLLQNVAGPRGTLLVLDDLHWAGGDACDLLRALVGAVEAPLRIVGAYRDSEVGAHHPLAALVADLARDGLIAYQEIGPLSAEGVGQLLEALAIPDAVALREPVWQRSGGVPLFVVSYVQGVLRTGRPATDIPWDVAQGIRQRVAALPETAQSLLGLAAVVGRVAPHGVLAAASGRGEEEVLLDLEIICRARLMAEEGGHASRFAHDVIREMVEADLGAARRALLHRRIGEALEQSYGGEVAAHAAELAWHYGQAGSNAPAARYALLAAQRAQRVYATTEALAQYAAARAQLLAAGHDGERLAGIDEAMGDLHMIASEFAEAEEAYRRARLAAATPDRRAELRRKEGLSLERRGAYEQALLVFADAEHMLGGSDDGNPDARGVHAALALSRAEVLWRQGEFQAAEAAANRALALHAGASYAEDSQITTDASPGTASASDEDGLQPAGYPPCGCGGPTPSGAGTEYPTQRVPDAVPAIRPGDPQAEARQADDRLRARAEWLLGSLAYDRGAYERAEALLRRSLVTYEQLEDQQGVAQCWNTLGNVVMGRGELPRAAECFRRALTIRERIGDHAGIATTWNALAAWASQAGDYGLTEDYLRRSLAIRERIGDQQGIANCLNGLAIVAQLNADFAQTERYLRRCMEIAERIGDQWGLGFAWCALGVTNCARGDFAAADEQIHRSLAIRERHEDRWGIAHCQVELGLLAGERGDPRAARSWCRAARRGAREIGAPDLEAHAMLTQGRALLRAGLLRGAAGFLRRAQTLVTAHGLRERAVQAAMLEAELRLAAGEPDAAWAIVEEALRILATARLPLYEAGLQQLMGRCALARGAVAEAIDRLRAAARRHEALGAAMELARTQRALGEALAAQAAAEAPGQPLPPEPYALLATAEQTFARAGAMLDLAETARLTERWGAVLP